MFWSRATCWASLVDPCNNFSHSGPFGSRKLTFPNWHGSPDASCQETRRRLHEQMKHIKQDIVSSEIASPTFCSARLSMLLPTSGMDRYSLSDNAALWRLKQSSCSECPYFVSCTWRSWTLRASCAPWYSKYDPTNMWRDSVSGPYDALQIRSHNNR